MKGYSIEIHRKVYDEDNGQFMTVRPSGNFPGNVMLFSEKSEEDYFGKQRIDMPAAFMRKIGEAIIAAADEVLKNDPS